MKINQNLRQEIQSTDMSLLVNPMSCSTCLLASHVLSHGAIRLSTRQGSLSEYVRVPSSCLVKRPSNITPIEAAGISLAALTSYQAIHHIAKVEPEQTVFINGGSSATGAFAIQIAKAKGARVVATASAKNEQVVRKLGADEVCSHLGLRHGPDIDNLISTF